jgi:hypothetical protein
MTPLNAPLIALLLLHVVALLLAAERNTDAIFGLWTVEFAVGKQ